MQIVLAWVSAGIRLLGGCKRSSAIFRWRRSGSGFAFGGGARRGKFCEGADRLGRIRGEAAGVAVSCLTHGARVPKCRSSGAIRSERAAAEVGKSDSDACG